MSMHDIEDVVEASIHCVDKSNLPFEIERNLLYNLYRFQSEYDTGYTNFRVKDILLKYHYMFELPLEQHPDYKDKKEEVESKIGNNRFTWLTNDSVMNRETKDHPMLFYTNVGTETWKRLVDNEILTDDLALPVKDMPILDLVLEIVKLCREQLDTHCAAEWYRTTMFYLLPEATDNDMPTINAIAAILFNDAVFLAVHNEYYFKSWLENLEYKAKYAAPLIREWYEVYKEWINANENNTNFHLRQTIQAFKGKRLDEAMKSCKKGLVLDPKSSFLLLYEAIISILLAVKDERYNIEDYRQSLEQLDKLQNVENETEANTKIIKAHSLYYTAYAHMVCGNAVEARRIAEHLVDTGLMPQAKEMIENISNIKAKK